MRVACVQMCSGDEVVANLKVVSRLLAEAAAGGATLTLLPENFSFMGGSDAQKRRVAEHTVPATVLPFLAEAAARHTMHIIAGTVLLPGAKGKLRNVTPVIAPDRTCLALYDKMHLFDVDLAEPGESYHESATVEAGRQPVSIDLENWRFGLSICYDLRFPELYRHYATRGCDALTVPSAFTVPTGRAHWEILLRARAIENQSYVLAPAQVGTHPGGRTTWGQSMVVDPWGEVLAQAAVYDKEQGAELLLADIDKNRLTQVRKKIPALRHCSPRLTEGENPWAN